MKESPEEKRARLLNLAKQSLGNVYSGSEHSIAQAIASYNELEKTRNLVHEKLEEWYGIFFPELKMQNQINYAKFISQFGQDKKGMDKEKLSALVGTATDVISKQAESSIGREPTEEEFAQLKALADLEVNIAATEEQLDKYLEVSTKKLMPNITYLIDYKVAAELLAKAGSLNKLAFMPAGTVQLLGAEKALFKHIKFGTKPPKYGAIFKLQQIGGAGRNERGRIARVYATKISIAARADAISKNFIADKLKEQLDKAVSRQRAEAESRPRPPESNNYRDRQGSGRSGNWSNRGGNRNNQGRNNFRRNGRDRR